MSTLPGSTCAANEASSAARSEKSAGPITPVSLRPGLDGGGRGALTGTMVSARPDPPMLAAAIEAAERGWSVVPLASRDAIGSLEPRVDVEPQTHHRATPDELRAWWRRWPGANAGVVTGMLSGVLVLEVDHRQGGDGSLVHLEAEFDPLPPTTEVRLGGWERQVWFRHDGPRVNSGPVAAGLSVQADEGLVVLPPSVAPSGETYHWEIEHPPGGHLPLPPDWLSDLARHPRVERPPVVEQLHLPVDDLLTPPPPPPGPSETTLPSGPAVEVVGESRHQRELAEVTGGRRPQGVDRRVTAELVPITGDSHDPHALGVRVHGVEVGRVVGAEAERCRPAVIAAIGQFGMATCAARIRGGWNHGRGDLGRLGITLYVDC